VPEYSPVYRSDFLVHASSGGELGSKHSKPVLDFAIVIAQTFGLLIPRTRVDSNRDISYYERLKDGIVVCRAVPREKGGKYENLLVRRCQIRTKRIQEAFVRAVSDG
jgi:hypothetical protein